MKNYKNNFIHLTNYSINKKNDGFMENKDWEEDGKGHKRSLSWVLRYLKG